MLYSYGLVLCTVHHLVSQQPVVPCAGRTVVEQDQVFILGFKVVPFDLTHIKLI